MRNRSAFVAGIFAGLSSLTSITSVAKYPRIRGSDFERMRQDVRRIGQDLRGVIIKYDKTKNDNLF